MPSTISAGTTAGTAIAIAGDTTGNLAFQTNGTTTAMTIDTSQNVGIGLTPPVGSGNYRSLNVGAAFMYGNTGLAVASYNNNADINDKYIINGFASSYTQSSGNHIWYGASSGTAGNAISFTERMRITSTGQVNLTRATGDDTQIDFLRMQGGGASAGDNLAFLSKYTTTVSTSAKAIFGGPPRGSLVVVTGYTGASYFSDILNCSSNSVTVISSQNSTGSPASRTYSIVSFLLNLQMGSGTYNVGTLLLGTAPRE